MEMGYGFQRIIVSVCSLFCPVPIKFNLNMQVAVFIFDMLAIGFILYNLQ